LSSEEEVAGLDVDEQAGRTWLGLGLTLTLTLTLTLALTLTLTPTPTLTLTLTLTVTRDEQADAMAEAARRLLVKEAGVQDADVALGRRQRQVSQ